MSYSPQAKKVCCASCCASCCKLWSSVAREFFGTPNVAGNERRWRSRPAAPPRLVPAVLLNTSTHLTVGLRQLSSVCQHSQRSQQRLLRRGLMVVTPEVVVYQVVKGRFCYSLCKRSWCHEYHWTFLASTQ